MADQTASAAPAPDSAGPDADVQARVGLGYVCAHHDEIRRDLSLSGFGGVRSRTERGGNGVDGFAAEPEPLRDLALALTGDQSPIPALDAIHAALLAAGDALGLYGRARPGIRGVTPPGVDTAVPPPTEETVYLCPRRRCSRYAWPGSDQPESCAITGEAFVNVDL